MTDDEIDRIVVDAAVAVHRELGPGLLETVYEAIMAHELRERGLAVARQVPVPLRYRGVDFEEGFRMDLLIQSRVIVEMKCVESLNNAHRKQLLTYLRLTGRRLGYLLNFNRALMREGIVRVANRAQEAP
ncbi:GxxExxY protein [Halofilum ochraceum]|uniref:GxxExxY protein n=1 Tax=Halofilum ochraceum TaxID=1611323 RepID=UPI0008D9759F|nr:GxxExxY protein [Halofilum ochraceum]